MKIVRVTTAYGVAVAEHVTVARTFAQRLLGLLTRSKLECDEGLLLMPGASIHTLAMRFVIDAVFLDAQRRVIFIAHCVRPNRVAIAPRHTRSVLELAAGRAAACSLEHGSLLTFSIKDSL